MATVPAQDAMVTYLLEIIEHATVVLGQEGYSHAGLTGSTSSPNAMGVVLNALGHVIVDHMRHVPEQSKGQRSWCGCCTCSPDIDATAGNIRCHEDILGTLLQAGQGVLPLLLVTPSVQGGRSVL